MFRQVLTSSTKPQTWLIHVVVQDENGNEMYQNARAGRAELLFLLIKPIVLWRSRSRRRRPCVSSLLPWRRQKEDRKRKRCWHVELWNTHVYEMRIKEIKSLYPTNIYSPTPLWLSRYFFQGCPSGHIIWRCDGQNLGFCQSGMRAYLHWPHPCGVGVFVAFLRGLSGFLLHGQHM